MRNNIRTFYRQRGTILVIAVFTASIISAIAARFTTEFQLSVARAEQGTIHTQLQQFLLSVESFAGWALVQDAELDSNNGRYVSNGTHGNYDHLQEKWSAPLQVPIDDASIDAVLEDALSRFNINQLKGRPSSYNPQGTFAQRFTAPQQRFTRLLQTYPDQEISTALAQEITEAVIDWLDADNIVTGQGGAENSYYRSLDKPYRAANRFFVSITELRQIKGMTQDLYRYLEPLLVALPNKEGFNINTASIPIIRSLNQQNIEIPLTEIDAAALIGSRPLARTTSKEQENVPASDEAYESVEDFLASTEANQVFDTNPKLWPSAEGLRTGSEFFILKAEAKILNYQRYQISILKREMTPEGVKAIVIRRTREQL